MALMILLAVPACSDSDSKSGDIGAPQRPAAEIAPLEVPAGFVSIEGDGFEIAAPDSFTPRRSKSSTDEPALVLDADDNEGRLVNVTVLREVDPRAGALEQADVLEGSLKDIVKATDVTRRKTEWPGARAAVMIMWSERLPGPDASAAYEVRRWQLIVEVNQSLLFAVLATSPQGDFERSRVEEVLRTFRPQVP